MQRRVSCLVFALACVTVSPALAQSGKIDTGDTAWVLASSALVLLMTPGLALFYGGMVRRKNALGTIMQSFIAIAVISVQWVLIGYSLAFEEGNKFVGGLGFLGLNNVAHDTTDAYGYAGTIPHQAYMVFQLMFAIITPALITGAFAERMKFSTYLVFLVAWATLVYDPIAHWVWGGFAAAKDGGGGWLRQMGALDFAGGTVVHINSGVAALVCAIVMGKRKGYPDEPMPPHNLTMTVLGTGLLWFGWFGFNGGSAVSSGGLATSAFVVTNTAAAAATLTWMIAEWMLKGKPTALGACSGAVAGLVAITPASGFVGPIAALIIGGAVGFICYGAVLAKSKLGYDDSLDTFGVHGIGGTWGALATGLFASKAINSAGNNGLFYGNPSQLVTQLIGVGATIAYSAIMTFIIIKVLDLTMGLRVKDDEEELGLDESQHGERGYILEAAR